MAGVLSIVYSIAVLVVAVAGLGFIFTVAADGSPESKWSLGGTLAAVALFLVAMVASLLLVAS